MGGMRKLYKILVAGHEGKRISDDLGVDGRIILKWINEIRRLCGLDLSGL
jgi:hypothetical protein